MATSVPMTARRIRFDGLRSSRRPSMIFAVARPPARAGQANGTAATGHVWLSASAAAYALRAMAAASAKNPARKNSRTCGYLTDGGFGWRRRAAGRIGFPGDGEAPLMTALP